MRLLGLYLRLLTISWRRLITWLCLLLSVRINLWLLLAAIRLRNLVTSLLLTVWLRRLLTVGRLLAEGRLLTEGRLLSIRRLLCIRIYRGLWSLAVSRESPKVIVSCLSTLELLCLDHLNEVILLHQSRCNEVCGLLIEIQCETSEILVEFHALFAVIEEFNESVQTS